MLSFIVLLAIVAVALCDHDFSSSASSRNRRNKEFVARNRKDLMWRIQMAVNKALLEQNGNLTPAQAQALVRTPAFINTYVKPFVRSYGFRSDAGSFEKTYELVKEIVKNGGAIGALRKRQLLNTDGDSSSVSVTELNSADRAKFAAVTSSDSISSSDVAEANARAAEQQIGQFQADPATKKALRVAFLKAALFHHLASGHRDGPDHEANNMEAYWKAYDHWEAKNKGTIDSILGVQNGKYLKKLAKDLYDTSSD